MQALTLCHKSFISQGFPSGVRLARKVLIPSTPTGFWDFYGSAPPAPGLQRCLLGFLEKNLFSAQLLKLDTQHVDRARLLSCSAKNAGLWLTTLPLCKEFTISDTNFCLAARFRLGLPPQDDLPSHCHCGTKLSTDPAHFLSCESFRRGPVTHRHNGLTQCLGRLVRRSGGSAYMEPSWLNDKRPDIHVSYADSRYLVDGSVAHPGAPSHCSSAAFTRLHAAKTRESRKITLYKELAAKENCKFAPFVMESFGGFGVHAKAFMDEMVRQANDHGQPSVIRFRDYAYRCLSICLLNGNCFVLHNGCLRVREWDGRYRRDRRRQSGRRSTYVYRPVPVSPQLQVALTIPDAPASISQ